jgi:hypothetical protein
VICIVDFDGTFFKNDFFKEQFFRHLNKKNKQNGVKSSQTAIFRSFFEFTNGQNSIRSLNAIYTLVELKRINLLENNLL